MRRTLYAAGNGEGYADVDALLADFEVRHVRHVRHDDVQKNDVSHPS